MCSETATLLWESQDNENDILSEHGSVSNSPGWPQARQAAEESLELLTLPLYFVRTVITPGSQQFLELFKKKILKTGRVFVQHTINPGFSPQQHSVGSDQPGIRMMKMSHLKQVSWATNGFLLCFPHLMYSTRYFLHYTSIRV